MTILAALLAAFGALALVGAHARLRASDDLLRRSAGQIDYARTVLCQAQMLNLATQQREATARDLFVRSVIREQSAKHARTMRCEN